ncbi:DUF1566 domain-containing protein [Stenotrophomonas sp. MMGLT7]|uniref:Lcl domain-containing protein n=1 Tax=Stenotrophomonas sp. MMGLT7 TaxID=2901227 RepID=UPI001E3AB9F0|nr:DUF1566 domain-containing protein [Stenotrophomonas sp. MMGLT7]MCD7096906.1 DUF1566 domain-containing protein [Stenotrophomonas sp. MMGLT7]
MGDITISTADAEIIIRHRAPPLVELESTIETPLAFERGSVTSPRWIKVAADGGHLPADSTRTDHVAVLDTHRRKLIYPHSIGVDGKRAQAKELLKSVTALDALGGGWQMAGREDAESILDLSRHNPAVDPNLFPGIKPEWHVTSTPAAWAPASAAWWVDFLYGGVSDYDLGYDGWALAVRPAGQ